MKVILLRDFSSSPAGITQHIQIVSSARVEHFYLGNTHLVCILTQPHNIDIFLFYKYMLKTPEVAIISYKLLTNYLVTKAANVSRKPQDRQEICFQHLDKCDEYIMLYRSVDHLFCDILPVASIHSQRQLVGQMPADDDVPPTNRLRVFRQQTHIQ